MFDNKGYKIKYVQKSSPGKSDDFVFAHIFKFRTSCGLKYISRAEMHEHNTFAVKYYASIHKKMDNKYSVLTNRHKPIKIFMTCASILPRLLSIYPTASFAFSGSSTIDFENDKMEGRNSNQRFRIYRYIADEIDREIFDHFEFPEMSSYLLINKTDSESTDSKKDKVKEMFFRIYNFDNQV